MLIFTSCINNYIPKARVLASSLKAFHPDWTFCLLLGEPPPTGFVLSDEPFDRLVTFDQLHISAYRSWLFRHRVVEICTAAKGPALYHFLVREKHEKVMYLDPDIMVCNTLTPLEQMLDTHEVLLTPHQLAPQETAQSITDNELCALRYGVFNLGFVAAARRADGLKFAEWWQNRLLEYCYDDIPNGIFTDQRWCDLAPAFFQGLHIVRDPGCNAASWNLTDRTITRAADGTFLANDTPLRFYHFTGFDSGDGEGMTDRYAGNMPAVRELWAVYKEKLLAAGHAVLGKRLWTHMTFNDGNIITDAMRLLYRTREDVQKAFPDPFIRPGFLEWYTTDQQLIPTNSKPLLRHKLAYLVRRIQQVLTKHGGFPRGLPGVARQILVWVRKWGLFGMLRQIWHSQKKAPVVEILPLLLDVLAAATEAPASRLFFRLLDATQAPVCVIEHDWGGGAEIYCQKRVDALLNENRVVIRLRYVTAADRIEMTISHGKESLRCEVKDLLELADRRFPHIDGIIVNEFVGWYYGHTVISKAILRVEESIRAVIQLAQHHCAWVEILFHDYYALCPSPNLLKPDNTYCGLPATNEACDVCALQGASFSMSQWRQTWGELMSVARDCVFFSEDTRDRVSTVYTLRPEQVLVRPHTVKPLGSKICISTDGPMRVAVVGNIQPNKGLEIVLGLAGILNRRMPEAGIVVFGELAGYYLPANVKELGLYRLENLAALLKQQKVTVGLFPSIWPETFSYVIHELASIDLPLVAFDLGAQGAYVRTLPNSRVVNEISAEAVFAALRELNAIRIGASA